MDKKKMSVAEMLAAARKMDAKGAAGESSEPAAAEKPATKPATAAAAKPAAAKTAAAKPASGGARPSVAEMMAMARAQKAGEAAEKTAASAEKPAPTKKEAPKPAAKAPAAEVPVDTGPKDTSSILAAARKEAKPGPMSKAEAAAKAPAKPSKPAEARRPVPPMPVKPDYAKPKPKPAPVDEGRRNVLMGILLGSAMSVGFTAMATTFGLWSLGVARFMFPNILTEPPSRFKVGFPSNFAPGQVDTRFVAQFGVWVVNYEYNGQSQIYALRTVCTHLGCTPNWLEGEQKFKCPCHGSGFYKDGINFEGPAPRPLERYAIRVADDGQLEIDKSKLFLEEKGDWADPASFVAV